MSEKLDGVRAYWDGQRLISRHEKRIQCPEWFIADLPKDKSLDGELWFGRGAFERVVSCLNSNVDNAWKEIKYVVFDTPSSTQVFEGRMDELAKLTLPPHVQIVERKKCLGNNHLMHALHSIEANGEKA